MCPLPKERQEYPVNLHVKICDRCTLVVFLLAFVVCVMPSTAQETVFRYETSIADYEKTTVENPLPENCSMFVGSSTWRLWGSQLEKDFTEFNAVNRGFGGATIPDVLYVMHRIITPYKPTRIVFFCGGNDIAEGASSEKTFENFKTFLARLWVESPQTKDVFFVSVTTSPSREKFREQTLKYNALVRELAEKTDGLYYIDTLATLLGEDGRADEKYFLQDRLHLNRDGQEHWIPVITAALRTAKTARMPIHRRVNVAHRGASAAAPENTLSAYRAAVEAGADGAECDVYRSADGVVFLSHDRTPKRTMGGSNEDLTKMTFEQIRKFDAGIWKGERFKGELVPTLDEFMLLLWGTSCHPVIEIKQTGIEADVIEIVRRSKMVDESTIIAFDAGVVREIRRLEPKICVAWLYSEDLKNKGTAEENADRLASMMIKRCRELDIAVIDLDHGLLSPKLVTLLREADIHVWAWTVDDASAMERYLDWGVVSITTNKPELLSERLKRRKKE
jgi:glycerophosphoryl diester phosphodiesterase/lysophospholipase L1-like esterase